MHNSQNPGEDDPTPRRKLRDPAASSNEGGPNAVPRTGTAAEYERWRAGDDGGFEALHSRLSPLLTARIRSHRAWRRLAGVADLDDVLQETWRRALPSALQRFQDRGPGALRALLAKAADRTVVDMLRRSTAKRRGPGQCVELQDESLGQHMPGRPRTATPTSQARATELEETAQRLLSPREIEVWELVELQGYTREEAAFATRTTASAVRGLLLRARTKLIAHLRNERRTVPRRSSIHDSLVDPPAN